MRLEIKQLIFVIPTILAAIVLGAIISRKWLPTVIEKEVEVIKLVPMQAPVLKGTIIDKGCTIDGKITDETITVNGKIVGEINTKEAKINGVVEGPITGEMVIVEPSANIRGDITSKGFEFKNGASYVGKLQIGNAQHSSVSAPINTSTNKSVKELLKKKLESISHSEEIELPQIKIEHINTKPFSEIEEIHIHVDNKPAQRLTDQRSDKQKELPATSNSNDVKAASIGIQSSSQRIPETRSGVDRALVSENLTTGSGIPRERPTSRTLISASDLVDLSWQVVKDTPEYQTQLKAAKKWDNPEDNLYAKIVSASGSAKSGKIEDLKKFFYVLALYRDLKQDPPQVVAELVQKNKKDFDELCSNWSWEAASATVQRLLNR